MSDIEIVPLGMAPNSYVPPFDLPVYWRNDVTGQLPEAIDAYLWFMSEPNTYPIPTERQVELIAGYFKYYINAPAWDSNRWIEEELKSLRESVSNLRSVDDISKWIREAMNIALDPL